MVRNKLVKLMEVIEYCLLTLQILQLFLYSDLFGSVSFSSNNTTNVLTYYVFVNNA